MKILVWTQCLLLAVGLGTAKSETNSPFPIPSASRLQVKSQKESPPANVAFEVPLPAHAAQPAADSSRPGFYVSSGRSHVQASPQETTAKAEYLLPDRDEKPPISPENANLNLPADLEIAAKDTGEKIFLPAGTYRQILQLPIDSPLMEAAQQTRRDQAPPAQFQEPASRYAEPDRKAVWVRYESLERIKIGEVERRGGLDLPSRGPSGLGPRVWYAKSETADTASSVFYFVFGGLGYSTANFLGWSAGNTREIPSDFEYRLIRR